MNIQGMGQAVIRAVQGVGKTIEGMMHSLETKINQLVSKIFGETKFLKSVSETKALAAHRKMVALSKADAAHKEMVAQSSLNERSAKRVQRAYRNIFKPKIAVKKAHMEMFKPIALEAAKQGMRQRRLKAAKRAIATRKMGGKKAQKDEKMEALTKQLNMLKLNGLHKV